MGAKVTHGQSRRGKTTPEFMAWQNIKERCYNPKNKSYPNYGGRGILMAETWRVSFSAFFAHVGPRPHAKAQIDRIDNEMGYVPGNVRWTTTKVQSENKRTSTPITWDGETRSVNEWARVLGIAPVTLWTRIKRWSLERAFTEPVRKKS